jgi:uncharacterized integral membrane protein
MASTTHSPPATAQPTPESGANGGSASSSISPTDGPPAGVPVADATATTVETSHGRSRRHARRARLYGYALTAVLVSAAVVALAASNTTKTKVSWIVGSSHVSLVWMVLATVVLGWLLGVLTAAALHRRTRAPR